MVRCLILTLCVAAVAVAQYEVQRKANDYPAHAAWPRFDIGAEYMTHSIPTESGSLFARDYLVVEVAVYPKELVNLYQRDFTMAVNGKKSVLTAEAAEFVASSLSYSDWEQHPTAVGTASNGAGTIMIGPPQTPRFPGDPTASGRPIGLPRREDTDTNTPPRESVDLPKLVKRAALSEGEISKPRKGSLFFAYQGKLKSIHTLDLIYDDTHGHTATLRVFP